MNKIEVPNFNRKKALSGAGILLAAATFLGGCSTASTNEVEKNNEVEKIALNHFADSAEVFPGDIIIGDVYISDLDGRTNQALFDGFFDHTSSYVNDMKSTKLIVKVVEPGIASATGSRDFDRVVIVRGLKSEIAENFIEGLKEEREKAGFRVDIVHWTGLDTTLDQAGCLLSEDKWVEEQHTDSCVKFP